MLVVQEMQKLSDNDANDGKAATATVISDDLSTFESKIATWKIQLFGVHQWRFTAKNIDRMSRRIFPMMFALFNLIYWTYYLTAPHFHCGISSQNSPDPCIRTEG
jgi:hypothetical protein